MPVHAMTLERQMEEAALFADVDAKTLVLYSQVLTINSTSSLYTLRLGYKVLFADG